MNVIKAEKESYSSVIKKTKLLVGITGALLGVSVLIFVIAGISVNNKPVLVTTTAATTTTKGINNVTGFSIGQFCLYHNQCPLYAFCSGTCQCPLNYYYDQVIGRCTLRKTFGAQCSANYECNIVLGLFCSTTCQCNFDRFWNTSYLVSGSLPLGRCQNKKVHGMACSSFEGVPSINYGNPFGSQIRRCWCEQGWDAYHSLSTGRCVRPRGRIFQTCNDNIEAIYYGYSMCMDIYRDGVKRLVPIPIMNYYQDYQWKRDINQSPCSVKTFQCNEYKNLVCQYTSGSTGICKCIDEYYYYNNTMCVYGKRYGEPCSSTSQCVPTSINLVCDYPYTGALNTVCRCANGTSFYDITTRSCQLLKTLNGTCRDSSDCSGGSTGSMFCGQYNGGSVRVCLCTDAYYTSGTTCVAKLTYNTACSTSTQCYTNLNQTCTGGNCGCSTGYYYSSTDSTCQYLKYLGDPCSSGSECWSSTCTSSLCT